MGMRRVLVGKRSGKRIFNWPGVFLAGLIVGMVGSASSAATWFLLTGEFAPLAVVVPVFLAIGFFVGTALCSYLATPLQRLPDLD
jgi:hypothetical protein